MAEAILALGIPCGLAFLLQRVWASLLGRPLAAGDEIDYIQRGTADDPFAPRMFLRVPLLPALAWLSGRSSMPETVLRGLSEIAATGTVLVVSITLWITTGPVFALIVGSLFALIPSRLIFARRIWPDVYLGFFLACILLLFASSGLDSGLSALLAGVICMFAFLMRFDALLLSPAVLSVAPVANDPLIAAAVLGPTILAGLCWAIFNKCRYGIFLPDNTWSFNLIVSRREARYSGDGSVAVESTIRGAVREWQNGDLRSRSFAGLQELYRHPSEILSGGLKRLLAALGPDSFARQRLLPPEAHGYESSDPGTVKAFRRLLIYEFPLIAGITFSIVLLGGVSTAFLVPTMGLAVGNLLMTRTRYRQAWLPGIIIIAGTSFDRLASDPPGATGIAAASLVTLTVMVVLSRFRSRVET